MRNQFTNVNPKSAEVLNIQVQQALDFAEKQIKLILKKDTQTLEYLNNITIALKSNTAVMELLQYNHPDKNIRSAAEKASQKLEKFFAKMYLRPDLYEAVKRVSVSGLDREARRFVEKELLSFKLMGVDKPLKIRKQVEQLMEREVKLGQAFDRNIMDDVQYIEVQESGLNGLPHDYKNSHKPDSRGIIKLSTQYPDYVPFMEYAADGALRKKFSFLALNCGWPKNEKVFKELLLARDHHAKLLGFENWADFVTADKMVKNSRTVKIFLEEVAVLTKKQSEKDYNAILARKRKDEPKAISVGVWESAYYSNLMLKEIGFDSKEMRNYFQFKLVKNGVLNFAERLFGLKFKSIQVPIWHMDVEAFDVYRNGKIIGRFYLDLHPRMDKYKHAACFHIRPGVRGVQLPEAALVCNFSRELLSHYEVNTFFHEFGHLMHYILGGGQTWCRFSGTATEHDFVEAPSQMLEAWSKDFHTLKTFARHYQTGKVIPDGLLQKMDKMDGFNRGLFQIRQTALSSLSLQYHLGMPKDLSALMHRQFKKYNPIEYPKGTHMYAGWTHLNGYSAMYYTYTWSRAIAEDILTPFQKHGMYDKKIAQKYVTEVLMPGGSKDAEDLIKNFLGRKWNLKAFTKWLSGR